MVNPKHMTQIASKRKVFASLITTLALTSVFSYAFIPTAEKYFHILWGLLPQKVQWLSQPLRPLAFPLLAALFYYSIPQPKSNRSPPFTRKEVLTLSLLPCLIALVYSLSQSCPSVVQILGSPKYYGAILSLVVLTPIGEELLFRGWLYALIDKFFSSLSPTYTNPLPLPVWMSSLAFSLWHLQNLAVFSPAFVLFQLLYTFIVGLWLGYLRWGTGKLSVAIFFHCLANLLANLL